MTLNLSVANRRLNLGDRILKACGKERRMLMPSVAIDKAYRELGPSAYLAADCRWEGFWSALFSRRRKESKKG